MPEVKRKGYTSVMLAGEIDDFELFKTLAASAHAAGLGIGVFTGYMKYQYRYLADHPEQLMVSASDWKDQDGLGTSNWGCPFHPDFKERYLNYLRRLAAVPGVEEIQVNDEAALTLGCYCSVCRAAYQREIGGDMPLLLVTEADAGRWKDPGWRRFLRWRLDRWSAVHGEMKTAIASVNPDIQAVFQSSPSVDLCWENPWQSAVDLAGMVEQIDGLSVDPYYTFHRRCYNPAEVYLSEWCRFLHGIVPAGKVVEVVPQGFSHPTFTRPLDERDGYWSAVIPVACGVDHVAPYTYTLMKCAEPLMKTYEASFAFDKYFAQAHPLPYVGLVHGANTEMFSRPFPTIVPISYDGTRMLPCAEGLRHKGLPYAYLPDRRLSLEMLKPFEAVVLPEIECLDEPQARAIREYWEAGGNLVVLGQLGTADAIGSPSAGSLLEDIAGIRVAGEMDGCRQLAFSGPHPLAEALPSVPEPAASRYSNGAMRPLLGLTHCKDIRVEGKARILAKFTDEEGRPMEWPAIVEPETQSPRGRIIYIAGFPSRTISNTRLRTTPRNLAHWLVPAAVEYLVQRKPALRVEGWPPVVPIGKMRPLDPRYMNTFEFFPLIGEDLMIGVVASYFKEPAEFRMAATPPAGRKVRSIRELVGNKPLSPKAAKGEVSVAIKMGYDDPLKIVVWKLA